jgi:hypothetical protein
MALINVDLNDAKELTPLPGGTYSAVVEKVEVRKNRNNEGQHIYVEMAVVDCADETLNGRKLFYRVSLPRADQTPDQKANTLYFVKQLVEACGAPWEPQGFDTNDLIGAQIQVSVSLTEYNGKPTNEVNLL